MKDTINTLLIGGSGIGVSGLAGEILPTHATDIPAVTNLIIQIIIGIATLFGLFTRKKVAKIIKN